MTLKTDMRLAAPDDVYEAMLSLAEGLDERGAQSALAAFALVLANHIGEDAVVLAAIEQVKQAFREFPEALMVGTADPAGQDYRIGGALDSLRKVIELKPAPTIPGAMTS